MRKVIFSIILLLFATFVVAQNVPILPSTQVFGAVNAADGVNIDILVNGQVVETTTAKDGKYGYEDIIFVDGTNIEIIVGTENSGVKTLTKDVPNKINLQFPNFIELPVAPKKTASTSSSSSNSKSGGFFQCTSEWSCTQYGACIAGKERRTCTDTKKCRNPTNSPPLEKECVVVKQPVRQTQPTIKPPIRQTPKPVAQPIATAESEVPNKFNFAPLIYIFVALTLLLGGTYALEKTHKRKSITELEEHEIEEYILDELLHGMSDEQIKQDLTQTTHNEEILHASMIRAKARYYIKAAKSHNIPNDQIITNLINGGWKAKAVNKMLAEANA